MEPGNRQVFVTEFPTPAINWSLVGDKATSCTVAISPFVPRCFLCREMDDVTVPTAMKPTRSDRGNDYLSQSDKLLLPSEN